jgi:hypothetical protein
VLAPRLRHATHERIARRRVAADRVRQLRRPQAKVLRHRLLRLLVLPRLSVGHLVEHLLERVVYDPLLRRIAPHDGEVLLHRLPRREDLRHLPGDLGAQRKQQHPRRRLVQTVDRVNVLTNLVAHGLHGELRLVTVDHGTVDQQPGGFVDGDEVVVVVEDFQHRHSVELMAALYSVGLYAFPPERRERANLRSKLNFVAY